MIIKYYLPYWGNEHLPPELFLSRAKDAGYDGVEINFHNNRKFADDFIEKMSGIEFDLICQQWQKPQKQGADDYINQMIRIFNYLVSFNPVFINSHTGRDFFSFEENCEIIKASQEFSKEKGIKIYHETHRGRCLYSPQVSKLYFNEFPNLRITADFSHWCCVSESLLNGHDEVIIEAEKRAMSIHARVGYSQGPQVNHPFAPENKEALEKHLEWWQNIIDYRKSDGDTTFHIITEFGPFPYMQALPFTNQPVANLWEINVGMMMFLKKELRI